MTRRLIETGKMKDDFRAMKKGVSGVLTRLGLNFRQAKPEYSD